MTGFVYKRFVKLLKSKGFRVVRQNYDKTTGIWIVRGKGVYGIIAPHMKQYYNADFFVDSEGLWDKFSRAVLLVDIDKVNFEDLLADFSFLNSEEGMKYSKTYAYLDDDKAKFKTMKDFSFPNSEETHENCMGY